eukprot:COSAG02_NODE_1817_length_10774_cov_19.773489_5_plen_409_part_00
MSTRLAAAAATGAIATLLVIKALTLAPPAERTTATATVAALTACADSDAVQCPLWARRGGCDTNGEWMKANCRVSCSVCSPGTVDRPSPAERTTATAATAAVAAPTACADSDAVQCPLWARRGDCDTNGEWMKANCRVSCSVCSPGTVDRPSTSALPSPPQTPAENNVVTPLRRMDLKPNQANWELQETWEAFSARHAKKQYTDVERQVWAAQDLHRDPAWIGNNVEGFLAYPATQGQGQAAALISAIRGASFCFREIVLTMDTAPGSTLLDNLVDATDPDWKEYIRVCRAVLAEAILQSQQACRADQPATVGRLERQPLSGMRVIELSTSREWTFQDSSTRGDPAFSCKWTKYGEGTLDDAVAMVAPQEATVVDGGGHNGETLTLLAKAFHDKPLTHIHVFEPSVSN